MRKWRELLAGVILILALSHVGANADVGLSRQTDLHRGQHHKHIHHSRTGIHLDGRPSAWCGWQMRQWKGGGSEYNLAANWAHRGTAALPGIDVVVVWPHHVGLITGYDRQRHQWIVKSGNDGHMVKDRPRSIAGAIAFRRI